jgi:Transposase DDE domain
VRGQGEPTQLRQMLPLLPPDAMLLADAGYTGYQLLKDLIDRGNCFLIRVGSNVKLIQHLGYARREGKQTVYLWPLNKQGRNKRSMPRTPDKVHPPLVLRLIELRDAGGKPVFLLTNVTDRRTLTDRVASKMYRLRWGIEVMWRGLKQTMDHHTLLGKIPGRAGAELDWAMAGLWMLQLLAASRMVRGGQSPTRHSPAKALRVVRAALVGRRGRGKSVLHQLDEAMKEIRVRRSSKQARYRRRKVSPRPPGRPEARTATAVEKQLIQRILEQPLPNQLAA